jgi:uncharacterized protein YkwD
MTDKILFSLIVLVFSNSDLYAGTSVDNFLSKTEKMLLDELNLTRSNPKEYANFLKELRPYYSGNELRRPGDVILITHEGVYALDEAINYLSSVKPAAPLSLSVGLSKSALDHTKDQAVRGAMGHDGSDGSQPWDRMNRYGTWQKRVAENIYYGTKLARDIVIQLIVDDGVPERGHRINIFNPEYHFVGIGCNTHAKFGYMCVMDFAAEFIEKQY